MIQQKYLDYIKSLLKIALPTCFYFLFLWCRTIVNIVFISNKYSDYKLIEAIGLTELYLNCTTAIVLMGTAIGIEILGSNYFGDKNYYFLGVTLIKAKLIGLAYFIIISIFNIIYAMKIISFLFKVEDDIIELLKPYFYCEITVLFLQISLNVDFRYLSIIGKLISTIMHIFFNFVFIMMFDMKLIGCGISLILVQIFTVFGLIFYIKYKNPHPPSNISINRHCFENWGEYLKICVPTTLMLLGEWMGFEIQAFIVMRFNPLDYSVHIIFINVMLMFLTFMLSINISISINIAAKIIEYSNEKLKEFIKICFNVSIIGILSLIFVSYLLKDFIFRNLTTGDDMFNLSIKNLPFFYLFVFFDNLAFFFSGVLKGMAYLLIPAIVNLFNFWVLQLIFSFIFAIYFELGVVGIWISLSFGTFFSFLAFFYISENIDINKMRINTKERIEMENMNGDNKSKSNLIKSDFRELDDFFSGISRSRKGSRIYNDDF